MNVGAWAFGFLGRLDVPRHLTVNVAVEMAGIGIASRIRYEEHFLNRHLRGTLTKPDSGQVRLGLPVMTHGWWRHLYTDAPNTDAPTARRVRCSRTMDTAGAKDARESIYPGLARQFHLKSRFIHRRRRAEHAH